MIEIQDYDEPIVVAEKLINARTKRKCGSFSGAAGGRRRETMRKMTKYIAAYIALLVFYGGDVATTSVMALLIGGLIGCIKIDEAERSSRYVNRHGFDHFGKILYWMPLPEVPEKEEEKKDDTSLHHTIYR